MYTFLFYEYLLYFVVYISLSSLIFTLKTYNFYHITIRDYIEIYRYTSTRYIQQRNSEDIDRYTKIYHLLLQGTYIIFMEKEKF